jgi:hypothetical protein
MRQIELFRLNKFGLAIARLVQWRSHPQPLWSVFAPIDVQALPML